MGNIGEPVRRVVRTEPEVPVFTPEPRPETEPQRAPEKQPEKVP